MPKKIANYSVGTFSKQNENRVFQDIDERLNELEDKVLRTAKKPDATRAEKMVLLMETGVIDYLFTLKISQKKIAQLLSIIINSHSSNIESDLSDRHNPKSYLKTSSNYKFALKTFKELKLQDWEEKCQTKLDDIERENN